MKKNGNKSNESSPKNTSRQDEKEAEGLGGDDKQIVKVSGVMTRGSKRSL